MRAASGGHVRCKKLKNSQLFENLNDAYIILMPMFATQLGVGVLCSGKIANQHFERKECFSVMSCEVL